MNFEEHQLATGSGMIELKNGIVTIKDEYLENKILMEASDYGFPSSINISTPVNVNCDSGDGDFELAITCGIDYCQGVTLNRFMCSITDREGDEFKYFLPTKLQYSIEKSIELEYNRE